MKTVTIEQLRAAVGKTIGVDPAQLTPETRFYDIPGFDSMAILILIVELDELGIEVPQDKASKIQTFRDVLRLAGLPE